MGALACAAVDRALAQEPLYPMAKLLEEALGRGLSPALVSGWPNSGTVVDERAGGREPRRAKRRSPRRRSV
jgi:hypothetical protein